MKTAHRFLFVLTSVLLSAVSTFVSASEVTTMRVPDGGIQPQAVMDGNGTLHMTYFKGAPENGDIFYAKSTDNGATFSKALQVSQGGSAIAMGNIRGARLALGKSGRAHVAWMGSNVAALKGPNNAAPMLYARLNDDGSAFETQRNVIHENYGLDGGGTVAADGSGNVFVFWHGGANLKGETTRRVWVARSSDEGKTFAAEVPAIKGDTGACGCCGMGALATGDGHVFVMYRAATEKVNRDMVLLTSSDKGATFAEKRLDSWNANMCPMSTSSLSASGAETTIAWENKGQIFMSLVRADGTTTAPNPAPGAGQGRKHPSVATNANGETLLAWTEGMAWQKGGNLAWQIFDKSGKPTEKKGNARGVPVWSLVAAVATKDGGFVIFY